MGQSEHTPPGISRKRLSGEPEQTTEDEDALPLPSVSKKARRMTDIERSSAPPRFTTNNRRINYQRTYRTRHRTMLSPISTPLPSMSISYASTSSSSTRSPTTPGAGDSQNIQVEVVGGLPALAKVEEKVLPEKMLLSSFRSTRTGAGIVPPRGRELRRHETTLWMGEIISRGPDEDLQTKGLFEKRD